MSNFHTHSLAPRAFVVAHTTRGVWRYVFTTSAEAQRNIARARFSSDKDWLALEQALKAYVRAITAKAHDI